MAILETTKGLLVFLILLLSAVGWGTIFLGFLDFILSRGKTAPIIANITPLRWYLSPVAGFGILSTLTLAGGLAGFYYSWFAWLLVCAGIGGGAVVWRVGKHHWPTVRWNQIFPRLRWEHVPIILLALVLAGDLAFILMRNVLVPPIEWDELAYHLALPRLYQQAHQIQYIPYMIQSNWPLGTEMLFGLGLLMGSDIASHVLTGFMILWGAIGVLLLGNHSFGPKAGWIGAVVFLGIPLVKRISGTGMIDPALVFYGTAAIICFTFYWQSQSTKWLLLTGAFSGMMAGSKLSGAAYLLLFGGALLVRVWPFRKDMGRVFIRHFLVLGVPGLSFSVPWYLRSTFYTGNPIYPFLYSIFGGKNWDALGTENFQRAAWNAFIDPLPRNPAGLAASIYRLFFEPAKLGGWADGIGWACLLFAGLGTLVALLFWRRTPFLVKMAVYITAAYYLLWFFLLEHEIRYLFPIFVPLACLAGFAFSSFWRFLRQAWFRGSLLIVLVILLAREFPWLFPAQRQVIQERVSVPFSTEARVRFLEAKIDILPLFRFANENLSGNSKILLLPYENRGYYLDPPYFWGHPASQRVLRFEQYPDAQSLAADLEARGFTHILDSPTWVYTGLRYWEHDHQLMDEVVQKYCVPMMAAGSAILCKLKSVTR